MASIAITGANQGIGYYMAEQLLEAGHKVAVLDLEIENIQLLKNKYEDRLLCFVADVREPAQVEMALAEMVACFQTIDVAVHNACLCTFDIEANTEVEIYRKVMDVNYFGALNIAKAVLPYMVKQNKGRIIFTSSGVGVTGFAGISPYASSKGAIESLAKCLKIEYAKNNISFHIFHPPLTRTKSSDPLPVPKEFMANPEIVGYGLAKHIMSKRFIICHSFSQKIQMLLCYLFPLKFGNLLSKLTSNYASSQEGQQ